MGSRLIIYLFIVGLQGLCGMLSSPGLVFAGLCRALSMSYMPAGGWVAVRKVWLFGKWFIFALCGVFGGSVMMGALKTCRGLVRSYSIFSFLLFSPKLRVGWPRG
jgi:hypothetical protein